MSENKSLIDDFSVRLEKLDFKKLSERLGASQHYIINELQKIGEKKYFIAEERVNRSDIVFYDKKFIEPVITIEYEQSGRYLETIQKMKKIINTNEGKKLKMLVFSFWYEDAEIRCHLLEKITKDLIECSEDNTKIWVLLGLSFPCYSNNFITKGSRVNMSYIEKSRTIVNKSGMIKFVPIYPPNIRNMKIPCYYYNGYLVIFFENGKIIKSKENFFDFY